MEIFKEGDKSRGICEHCKKISETTFQVKTSTIQDGAKLLRVPDILVAVCDTCDRVTAIPQQSFAAVAEHRKKAASKSEDFRVPRHFLDILNLSISIIGLNATKDLRARIVRYYIASLNTSKEDIKHLKRNLESELLSGNFKRRDRLPMRISSELSHHFSEVIQLSRLTRTQILDSIIVRIKEDVLDRKDSTKISNLKTALMG